MNARVDTCVYFELLKSLSEPILHFVYRHAEVNRVNSCIGFIAIIASDFRNEVIYSSPCLRQKEVIYFRNKLLLQARHKLGFPFFAVLHLAHLVSL